MSGHLIAEAADIERQLAGLVASGARRPDPRDVLVLLGNIEHMYVYLAGNRVPVPPSEAPGRAAGRLGDRGASAQLRDWLERSQSDDPEVEKLRLTWSQELDRRLGGHDVAASTEAELVRQLDGRLDGVRTERAALLGRLGVPCADAGPDVTGHRLSAATEDPRVRSRLARAWARPVVHARSDLFTAVDRLVAQRTAAAQRAGHRTAAERSFAHCEVDLDTAHAFARDYLAAATGALEELGERLAGFGGDPMDHVAYVVRRRAGGRTGATFSLEALLALAADVVGCVSTLDVRVENDGRGTTMWLGRDATGLTGAVRVDVVGDGLGGGPSSEPARPVRPDRVVPVGRALARVQPGADGAPVLRPAAADSLWHELGHALGHVLTGWSRGAPGIGHRPPERLEELSEWFQTWTSTDRFAQCARAGDVPTTRAVARLEFLGAQARPAVAALLDLMVHADPSLGSEACFDRLDRDYAIARFCDPAEVVGYFGSTFGRAHPALGFAYPWGFAFGAEQAVRAAAVPADVAAQLLPGGVLRRTVDETVACAPPQPAAVFDGLDVDRLVDAGAPG